MGLPADLNRNENSHFEKIWLFQVLEKNESQKRWVCAMQMDLNSNIGTTPMEILFWSFWSLKQKPCFQNSVSLLPLWVVEHFVIQPGTGFVKGVSRNGSTRTRTR